MARVTIDQALGSLTKNLIEQLKKCTQSVIAFDCKHLLNCLLKSTALELTNDAEATMWRNDRFVGQPISIKSLGLIIGREICWSWDLLKLIPRERQLYL